MIELYSHQTKAIDRLRSGSILCGGTGSGKSLAALAFYLKEYKDKKLYIITTAKKRDSLEWEQECVKVLIDFSDVVVDSWNNIKKYVDIEDAFVIFDEQRVVGYGAWTKSFLKIVKRNPWILLSATPGDTWLDYMPVFIANGFYKNKTDFVRRHVVYKMHAKYPIVDRYVETDILVKIRNMLLVNMKFIRETKQIHKNIFADYDKELYLKLSKDRWNVYKDEPIKDASQLCFALRRCVNESEDRKFAIKEILNKHPRVIIFYNFNYELERLLELSEETGIKTAQLNGHKHEDIPKSKTWLYLVQYTAGSEAWNCIETDTMIFYSQNYSYRTMTQAAGRIDRLNTPFTELYYYHIISKSSIDTAISKKLKTKENFNERKFMEKYSF